MRTEICLKNLFVYLIVYFSVLAYEINLRNCHITCKEVGACFNVKEIYQIKCQNCVNETKRKKNENIKISAIVSLLQCLYNQTM